MHITVIYKNRLFAIDVIKNGEIISHDRLTEIFEEISTFCDKEGYLEYNVMAYNSMNRDDAAKLRELLHVHPQNDEYM